jgi:PAS domain S-box-containing protein
MDRLLQGIIDILPVGVGVTDVGGRLVRSNTEAKRIWNGGRPAGRDDAHPYKGWWADSGKPLEPEDWGIARAIERGETSVGQRIRIQCRDGTFKTILHSAAPLYDDNGDLTGAVLVNEDITPLQEVAEQADQREQLLRTAFDLLPVGVWVTDRSGHVTLANPAARRIWGRRTGEGTLDLGEFVGWWADTGQPIAREEWASSRALRDGRTSRNELIRIRTVDGSSRTIINSAAPIRSETGKIVGAVGVNEDVSSIYRVQEQLRAAVRDREEILAIVAHDLRSPLGGIMLGLSMAEHAAGRQPGGEALRDRLAALGELSRNMAGMIDDLLAVAVATGQGKSMLEVQAVAPATLVDQAFDRSAPLFAARGVRLKRDVMSDLPDICVDPERILRVTANLLDNALKFTDPDGEVTLSATTHGRGVIFGVANSGPALTAEQRQAMFQPFWQARHDCRGAGLGLSICRSIVEAHGGSIWAERAEGQRVQIRFELPRIQTPAGN